MDTIEDYCHLLEFKYSGKSKSFYDSYKFAFKRLAKEGYINDIQTKSLDIKPLSMELSFGDVSLSTKIKNFQALIFILIEEKYNENTLNHFKTHFKTLCDRQNEKAEDQEMTEKQMKNWIDYPDLFERFVQFYEYEIKDKDVSYMALRNYTLIGLFVCIPPARISNYTNMKFKEEKVLKGPNMKKDYNYLCFKRSKIQKENGEWTNSYGQLQLIFNSYKTSNCIGQVVHGLLDAHFLNEDCIKSRDWQHLNEFSVKVGYKIMAELMVKYLEKREEQRRYWVGLNKRPSNCWLFTCDDGSPMTPQNMTFTLNTTSNHIFGKELSCNMFRHIFLTHFFNKNYGIGSNKRVAMLMGQTYNPTMMEKYVKKPIIENDKDKISVSFS